MPKVSNLHVNLIIVYFVALTALKDPKSIKKSPYLATIDLVLKELNQR